MGGKDLSVVGTNWIWEVDSEEGREETNDGCSHASWQGANRDSCRHAYLRAGVVKDFDVCIEGVVHGVCGTVIPMGQVPQQFQNLEENNNIQEALRKRAN